MLDQVLSFFDIVPDYDLDLMQPNQTLFTITAKVLTSLESVLEAVKPDLVFVQGDTTTVLASALGAFYKRIKVAHIEAGLRSLDKFSPFPEEINRVLTSRLTDLHFTPTIKAAEFLALEGITNNVFTVGNTVIDALFMGLEIIKNTDEQPYYEQFSYLDFTKKVILVTCHRRESFGEPFEDICKALLEIAQEPDVQIVYPVHLNPNIKEIAHTNLGNCPNIFLISPLPYPELIWLMEKSYMVLTDSGGIQEEAPSLSKPVLVLRNVTERMEGVEAGTAILVGTDRQLIVEQAKLLLTNNEKYKQMAQMRNPYGDGTSCLQIIEIVKKYLSV
jgi:UDP-N-acetylglucosamine 2-epimerase (non-hydrolysing)